MANGKEIIKAIEASTVVRIPDMEQAQMSSLWADQTVVITYLRRFGCIMCKQGAIELSKIAPLLRANNIRLIGIGLEELGYEEFLERKFFDGDIYLDTKLEQYKALGFKKYNHFNIWFAFPCWDPTSKKVQLEGIENKLGNNFKGNGFQSGGTLIVEKGGKSVILSYKMAGVADHLENSKILAALGIQDSAGVSSTNGAITIQPTCNDHVCTR